MIILVGVWFERSEIFFRMLGNTRLPDLLMHGKILNVFRHGHYEFEEMPFRMHEALVNAYAGLLREVGAGMPPDDAEVAKEKLAKQRKRNRRHWKTKMWKRRSKMRQERAEAFRLAGEAGAL